MAEPLTPADCDLRGLEYMPLLGAHLFGSEFNARATDSEWRAALTLWWAAWTQVPAASLPDDDAALCRFADLGRDLKAWRKLREGALHGWVKCDDGRLYHPLLAKQALIAWDKRVKERERKAAWRAKREGQNADVPRDNTGTETGTPAGPKQGQDGQVPADVTRRDGTGRDSKEKEESSGDAAQKRGHRLRADFVMPEPWLAWAMEDRGWDRRTASVEADSFADHWRAKSGKDAVKLDWQATWRNWVRNSRRSPTSSGGSTYARGLSVPC